MMMIGVYYKQRLHRITVSRACFEY